MLIHLYTTQSAAAPTKAKPSVNGRDRPLPPLPNGHATPGSERLDRQAQDAQEFELEALMSEDEDDEQRMKYTTPRAYASRTPVGGERS